MRIEASPKLYYGRAALAAGLFGAFFLMLGSGMPCSFAQLTHHPCPGCGSTRAAWAIFRGDFSGALRFNVVGPFLAGVVALFCLHATYRILRDGTPVTLLDTRLGRVLPKVILGLAGVELLLWIVRFFGMFGGPVPV